MVRALNGLVDDDTAVAVDVGFVESADPAWLGLPPGDERRGFLLAPFSYYRLRGRLEPAPSRLDERTRPYLENVLRPTLLAHDRFLFVGRGRSPRWWYLWIDGRFTDDGYTPRTLYQRTVLQAVAYERLRDVSQMPATSPITNGSTK